MSTGRQANKSLKSFESRFEAQLTRLKAHGGGSILVTLFVLILLSHVNIEDSQEVVLSASVQSVSPDSTDPSVADMMSKLQYSSIAAVLRLCDLSSTKTRHDDGSSRNSYYANGRNGNNRRRHGRGSSPSQERTAAKTATLKAKYLRTLCKKKSLARYGHWSTDHNPDATIKNGVLNSETSLSACKNKTTALKYQANNQTPPGFKPALLGGIDDTLYCDVASTANFELKYGSLVHDSVP